MNILTQSWNCPICDKSFNNFRSCKQHRRWCKYKTLQYPNRHPVCKIILSPQLSQQIKALRNITDGPFRLIADKRDGEDVELSLKGLTNKQCAIEVYTKGVFGYNGVYENRRICSVKIEVDKVQLDSEYHFPSGLKTITISNCTRQNLRFIIFPEGLKILKFRNLSPAITSTDPKILLEYLKIPDSVERIEMSSILFVAYQRGKDGVFVFSRY